MPKILFIQPAQYSSTGDLVKQKKLNLPGLVFPLLAAMIPKNWEVEVRLEVIENIPLDTDADIIGIGAMGHAIVRAFELAKHFRERGKKVVLGGCMASIVPEYSLNYVDSVVVGDAEISIRKLIDDFETSGQIAGIYNNPVDNLDGLPVPCYETITGKPIGDMLPVQAGRGCVHRCVFCSISCIYRGRYLVRPIPEVMRDINKIKSLGFRKFYLIDDNIAGNPDYLEELCNRIKPLKMTWASQSTLNLARNEKLLKLIAESGCRILSLGLESISQDGLDRLNKKWLRVEEHDRLLENYRKAGIMVSAEMIIGTDGDTVDSLKATYDFIMKHRIPLVRVYILTPVFGTPMYQDLLKEGRIIRTEHQYFDAAHCIHIPQNITPGELEEMYRWLNMKIFSIRSILQRTISNRNILRHPYDYLMATAINLHYRKSVMKGDTPLLL